MNNNVGWLIILILVGCLAAFLCSCRKDCGISYELDSGEHSGAGYVQIGANGELCFSVWSDISGEVALTVRGRGESVACLSVGTHSYTLSFSDDTLWEEVEVRVHLEAGINTVSIRNAGGGASPLQIDYVELP